MSLVEMAAGLLSPVKARIETARADRRLARLRARGLHVGEDVYLPESTMIDEEYCHLIWISDSCSFGAQVMLLAHEEQSHLGRAVTRVGTIYLDRSCHLGARTLVLPGVVIGPRTIVAACSVVRTSLPPDTVCAGNPARPFSSLARYLDAHRTRVAMSPAFGFRESGNPARHAAMIAATRTGDAYMLGGRSAELAGTGGSRRTPRVHHSPVPPEPLPPGLLP